MLNEVLLARHHFEVLRNIVGLVAIFVMNLFAINKPAAEAIFGDHPVLVCISTNIGQVVPGSDTDQHVSVRCYRAPTAPVRV